MGCFSSVDICLRKTSVVSITNHSTLLLRSHIILYLENFYYKNPLSSAVMASPVRPDKSNLLKAGGYNFTMGDVEQIYGLYSYQNWTLWEIKGRRFQEASIKQIAVVVSHGQMDQEQLPYTQRGRFTYDPDLIDLNEFNVGQPSQ